MASRRKEYQEDAKLRVLQIIKENPQSTTREVAQKVGISNGSAYYLLTSLIENSKKINYSYLLTPKGIREKSVLTNNFLIRKKKEFVALRNEIQTLEQEIGANPDKNDKDSR